MVFLSALPRFFGSGFFVGAQGTRLSGVVEDQDVAVVERDLFRLPGGALNGEL